MLFHGNQGDLEETTAELEESRRKLVSLKTQRDATPGASIPVLHLGNKNDMGDKSGDKNRELEDIEAALEATKVMDVHRFLFSNVCKIIMNFLSM